jgi:hypothetical protein
VALVALSAFLVARCLAGRNSVQLTVRVVDALWATPVTGATVKVVPVGPEGQPGRRARARASLDAQGHARLRVPPGSYLVRMASGYTGQARVDVSGDTSLTLKVLPVVQ